MGDSNVKTIRYGQLVVISLLALAVSPSVWAEDGDPVKGGKPEQVDTEPKGESRRAQRKTRKIEERLKPRLQRVEADIAYCEAEMTILNEKHAKAVMAGVPSKPKPGKGKTPAGTTELDPGTQSTEINPDPYAGLTKTEIATFEKCREKLPALKAEKESIEKNIMRKKVAVVKETGQPYKHDKATFTQPFVIPKVDIPKVKNIDPFEANKKRAYDACWEESDVPVEIIPAIFDAGKSTLTESQARKVEADVQAAWKQMKAAGFGRISRIVAVPSSSQIPSLKKKNEELAEERAREGIRAFRGAFRLGALTDPFSPSYQDGVTTDIPRLQGPAWEGNASRALRGKPVTEADLQRVAEELAQDPNVPVRTVEDLRACCAKDQYTLRFYPYQYVKLQIYPAIFKDGPACQAAYEADRKPADQTKAKDVPDPGATVPSGDTGTPNTSGELD